MIDEEGNRTTFSYNRFDQLTEIVTPEGVKQTMSYDQTNNLVDRQQVIQSATVDATMIYDVLDRLTRMEIEQSATQRQQIQWSYEPHDLIKTMTQANGTKTSYEYDHNDQIIAMEITDGITIKKYAYRYNDNQQIIAMSEPNGAQTQWERD